MKKIMLIFTIMLGLSFLLIENTSAAAITCNYKSNEASLYIQLGEQGHITTSISISEMSGSPYVNDYNVIKSLTKCPQSIYYACDSKGACEINTTYLNNGDIHGIISLNNKSVSGMDSINFGENIFSGNKSVGSCSGYFGSANNEGDIMYVLTHNIFTPIKILVPIVLVILTSFDFLQAVFNDKKEGIPKATTNFIRRAIISLLIFFAPYLLSLILTIIDASAIKECLTNFM